MIDSCPRRGPNQGRSPMLNGAGSELERGGRDGDRDKQEPARHEDRITTRIEQMERKRWWGHDKKKERGRRS